MTNYTPQHEEKTGADLTGSDGAANRTYTLANANSISAQFHILVDGSPLQANLQFTKSASVITFLTEVWNAQEIVLDYFTSSTSSISSSTQYCTTADVRRLLGITSTDLGNTEIEELISMAEAEVDILCGTTFLPVQDDGTATSGASTSLMDSSQAWNTNEWASDAALVGGFMVHIYAGTGSGQSRVITSNTATALTVSPAWTTNPASGSKYRIFKNTHLDETFTGDGYDVYYTRSYPILSVQSLTLDGTSITTSTLYNDLRIGKVQLGNSSESIYFTNRLPLLCNIKYSYGIYPVPGSIRKLTAVLAGIDAGNYMMGNTVSFATSYSLPDFQVHRGEPYPQFNRIITTLEQTKRQMIQEIITAYKRPFIL